MITNKVLDQATVIGELWIYGSLMSRLERNLQLKAVKYTPLFTFPRRETTYTRCDSGFEFSMALLKRLKVCETQDEFQRHKWLLGSSAFLLLAPLSSLGGYIGGNKAGFHSTRLKLLQVAQVLCRSALGVHWAAPHCGTAWLLPGLCWGCTVIWAWDPVQLKEKSLSTTVGGKWALRDTDV